jgi:hypothetical protein
MRRLIIALATCLAACSRETPQAPATPEGFFPPALKGVQGEKFDLAALQLENLLTQLADRLEHFALTDAEATFSSDFRGVPPLAPAAPGANPVTLADGAIEILHSKETETSSTVSVGDALRAALRDCVRVSCSRIKMPTMNFWERGIFGTVRLELNGERRDGSGFSIQERFDAVFVLRDEQWQIQKFRRTERREVRCPRPLATEAGRVLGLVGHPETGPLTFISPYDGMRGVAAGDLDGDGYLDVALVSPFEVRLFRNEAGRRFIDVTKESGVVSNQLGTGALFWDYDADGDLDFCVSQFGGGREAMGRKDKRAVVVWRNEGGFKFADATAEAGLVTSGPATSMAAVDFDRDGDLDLYVCMYGGDHADRAVPTPITNAENGAINHFWINQGNGKFVEGAKAAGVADSGWSLACTFGDVDADGWPDLYLANDFGPHRLYRNRKDGTFERQQGDHGFGMGASWGDYDNDGDLDVYVSNMYSTAGKRLLTIEKDNLLPEHFQYAYKTATGNTMLRNDGGKLVNATEETGVGQAGWAWGNTFIDWDNDGRLDLYVANGYISGLSKRDR